ncbi:MAG: hypothetical protein ABR596_02485, partial [Halarsenatibacteraceae bacterium]
MEMMEELKKIIEEALMPAQGCTDPVSVAFAAARARQELSKRIGEVGELEKIKVTVNANLYKNAARVTIPGTTDCGVTMAAALGYLAGDSDRNLEVLSELAEDDIEAAKELVEKDLFEIEINRDINRLLIDLELTTSGNIAGETGEDIIGAAGETGSEKLRLVILDYYTSVEAVEYGAEIGNFKIEPVNPESRKKQLVEKYDLEDFIKFAKEVEVDQLKILKEGIKLSKKLADEGMEKSAGM